MLPKIKSPVFKLTVPSSKKEVTMRHLTARDEKILLIAKEEGTASSILDAVKQVVYNCVENYDFQTDFTLFDVEYLFIQLRAASISNIAKVAYKDRDDEKVREFDVDLTTVEVKFPEKEVKNIKVSDTVGIVMKYPLASLYSDKEFMNATGEKVVDLLIRNSIETIYDGEKQYNLNDVSDEEFSEFINSLDLKVYNQIKEFFNDLPKLYYEIKYTNEKGDDRLIVLSSLNDFFTLA